MSPSGQPTFENLLSQKQWTDYNTFVSEAPKLYAGEIAKHVATEREIIRRSKEHELFKKLTIRETQTKECWNVTHFMK
jgi:hypothetical protein